MDQWDLHPGGAFVSKGERSRPVGSSRFGKDSEAPFDEIYLRLFALDLDREDTVLEFVNEFGLIHIYEPHETDPWRVSGAIARPPYPVLSAYPGFDGLDDYDLVPELLAAAQAARSEVVDLREVEIGRVGAPATIHEFRWAARCMRDLVRAYRSLSEGRPATDFTWDNPLVQYDADAQRRGSDRAFWLTAGLEIQEFVSDTLGLGLAGYAPRLTFREDLWPARPRDWAEQFGANADPWSVCCLELFNHITEGILLKDCANETCGRPFARQTGRAMHGQRRRSGVRYCSHACARAQAQRQYQRRSRAAAAVDAS